MDNIQNNNNHGGDFYLWQQETGISQENILDFSVNVRPDGMPDFIKASLFQTLNTIQYYPSKEANELKDLASQFYHLKPENFVFANGSNELFFALTRALRPNYHKAIIIEPAFSEYQNALEKNYFTIEHIITELPPIISIKHLEETGLFSKEIENQQKNIIEKLKQQILSLEDNCLIFLANPSNPCGSFIPQNQLLSIIQNKQQCLFIIDEAFIEYTKAQSLIYHLPKNAIIIRSLTKFYALAGLRLGYLACHETFAQKIQKELPCWNVNTFAIQVAKTLFTKHKIVQNDLHKHQELSIQRKKDLYKKLLTISGLTLYASWANYIFIHLDNDYLGKKHFWLYLLEKFHITIRDCSNYYGLKTGYYRIAVRFEEDHTKLCNALSSLLFQKNTFTKKKTPALMLLGTSSNAGKSILTAAFCRIFTQDGYKVRPFKAQNMSLNSGVTALGEEMGRAQLVQAIACKVDPDARMNPILLKPQTDMGSQIIVLGKPIGTALAKEYYQKKNELWKYVTKAYDELANEADIMVLEGAGSPAEINLKENDIVNIKMAQYANASTLLVGDIDRGGIYASFLGTWQTFNYLEEKQLTGFLVNRFRGDSSLLAPAHTYMQNTTGKPVLGIIPYIKDLNLPEEDMAGSIWANKIQKYSIPKEQNQNRKLDIAIIMLNKISNHTDFEALALEQDCIVRAVRTTQDFGDPDLVILPGSKSVVEDLKQIRSNGLAQKILEFSNKNGFILGICGGLQMLGKEILDPYHIETNEEKTAGLGLLPLTSTFNKEKCLTTVENIQSPLSSSIYGYEIHHGETTMLSKNFDAYFQDSHKIYGYVKNTIWATYIHGLFDSDNFRHEFLNYIRQHLGLNKMQHYVPYNIEKSLDNLANIVRNNVDMNAIYQSLGLSKNIL